MASPAALVEQNAGGTLIEPAGGLRYVARQPILDTRGALHGYELLFRSGPEAAFGGDGDLATRTMLDNTVIFGLEQLTGGLPAFVNCTGEALIERLVDVLPPAITVLEVLETLEPTPTLIAACRKLKDSGFRLALDDFVWRPGIEPLVGMADYIKVDFLALTTNERAQLLARLKGSQAQLLAEKVETQEEYRQALGEGFTLFQGYYFCRPTLLRNFKVPANRLFHIEILQSLQRDPIDMAQLSALVKRDPSLTWRLLRLFNSPVCAMRQEIRSIRAALMAVGVDTFRRIATLAIASEFNAGQAPEILRMAFVRGRFCELAAAGRALDPTEQYLLGMLSLLPAMLRVPIGELAPKLPLRDQVRRALAGEACAERSLLDWVECHERGDWEGCDAALDSRGRGGGAPKQLARSYAEAVVWAESALHAAL